MDKNDVRGTLEHLIETCRDGEKGFAQAADSMTDGFIADVFRTLSEQRGRFADELTTLFAQYGGDVDDPQDGSVKAALHRGWISLKGAVTGGDVHAVVSAAEEGEDYAVNAYREALSSDLPSDVRQVVERQAEEVQAAHDRVRGIEVTTE